MNDFYFLGDDKECFKNKIQHQHAKRKYLDVSNISWQNKCYANRVQKVSCGNDSDTIVIKLMMNDFFITLNNKNNINIIGNWNKTWKNTKIKRMECKRSM